MNRRVRLKALRLMDCDLSVSCRVVATGRNGGGRPPLVTASHPFHPLAAVTSDLSVYLGVWGIDKSSRRVESALRGRSSRNSTRAPTGGSNSASRVVGCVSHREQIDARAEGFRRHRARAYARVTLASASRSRTFRARASSSGGSQDVT